MEAIEAYGRPRDFVARMAGLGRPVLWSLAATSLFATVAAIGAGSWALYEARHAADSVQRYVVYLDGQSMPVGQARISSSWQPGDGAWLDFARRWVRFLRARPLDIETLKYQRREVIWTTDARVYAALQSSMHEADEQVRHAAVDVQTIAANLVDSSEPGPGGGAGALDRDGAGLALAAGGVDRHADPHLPGAQGAAGVRAQSLGHLRHQLPAQPGAALMRRLSLALLAATSLAACTVNSGLETTPTFAPARYVPEVVEAPPAPPPDPAPSRHRRSRHDGAAIVAEATRRATVDPDESTMQGATWVIDDVQPSAIYRVRTALNRVTTILLPPGERFNGAVGGDVEHFLINVAYAGPRPAVSILPRTREAKGNLQLVTTGGFYSFDLLVNEQVAVNLVDVMRAGDGPRTVAECPAAAGRRLHPPGAGGRGRAPARLGAGRGLGRQHEDGGALQRPAADPAGPLRRAPGRAAGELPQRARGAAGLPDHQPAGDRGRAPAGLGAAAAHGRSGCGQERHGGRSGPRRRRLAAGPGAGGASPLARWCSWSSPRPPQPWPRLPLPPRRLLRARVEHRRPSRPARACRRPLQAQGETTPPPPATVAHQPMADHQLVRL